MLTREQKPKIVDELVEKFQKQKIAIFSDFQKTSVSQFQKIRRELKQADAEFKVAKKTLLDRALEKIGSALRTKELRGEIGVTFGYGDEIAPAKILSKFKKENENFQMLTGILNGRILTQAEITALAKLPAREVLISQLIYTLQYPLRGLIGVLRGNMRNLVVVLSKIADKK